MRIRLLLLNLLLIPAVQAQGVMQPLTIQGIQQQDPVAVRSRAMGGAFAASGSGNPETILLNPAGLAGISRPALSVAGVWQSRNWAETQHWNPNRYYAGISLYFSDPEAYRSAPFPCRTGLTPKTPSILPLQGAFFRFLWAVARLRWV